MGEFIEIPIQLLVIVEDLQRELRIYSSDLVQVSDLF
jgi:hypothetical protein